MWLLCDRSVSFVTFKPIILEEDMKFLKGLIFLLVVAVAGVHGYFYSQYSTANACTAAVERIKKDLKEGNIGEQILGLGILLGQEMGMQENLEGELRKKGVSECYKVALFGLEEE